MSKPLDESILCRAAVQLSPTATGVMMYMPGGLQTITPWGGAEKDAAQRSVPITVLVDAGGSAELNRQHAAIVARGKKPARRQPRFGQCAGGYRPRPLSLEAISPNERRERHGLF